MIVEPDFPDHWKTKLLVQLTGDPCAPMMLIRLWCHCHARKTCRFSDLTDDALAAICCWTHQPSELRAALIKAGFLIEEPEGILYVHDWDVINAKLFKNWNNGALSLGRPKKPNGNPTETQYKPTDNPTVTESEPTDNPTDNPTETQYKPTDNPTVTQYKPTDNPTVTDRLKGLKGLNGSKGGRGGKPRSRAGKSGGFLPEEQPESIRNRMISINALKNRKADTFWSAKEMQAFRSAGLDRIEDEIFSDQLAPLASYYAAEAAALRPLWRSRDPDADFRRRDLLTLLNNWAAELDRAHEWAHWLEKKISPAGGALARL